MANPPPLQLLLAITVCPRENGTVRLPVEKGSRRIAMNARSLAHHLEKLIAARGLTGEVWVRKDCAGGCWLSGPNVNVDCFAKAPPGEVQDHVAIGGKTYVYSLGSLDYVGQLIDENLTPGSPRGRRAVRSGQRRGLPR